MTFDVEFTTQKKKLEKKTTPKKENKQLNARFWICLTDLKVKCLDSLIQTFCDSCCGYSAQSNSPVLLIHQQEVLTMFSSNSHFKNTFLSFLSDATCDVPANLRTNWILTVREKTFTCTLFPAFLFSRRGCVIFNVLTFDAKTWKLFPAVLKKQQFEDKDPKIFSYSVPVDLKTLSLMRYFIPKSKLLFLGNLETCKWCFKTEAVR